MVIDISSSCRRPSLALFLLVLILTAVLAAAPLVAQKKTIEGYRANAMVQGVGGGQASMVEINIYRWSTDEEREALLQAVKDASAGGRINNREVAKALRGQAKAGYAFLAGEQGYPLRYSRQVEVDGKRRIILATDRPVSFAEVYDQTRLGDFDVSMIILDVDEAGNGEGVLSLGTEVVWDEVESQLKVTNVSSQPIRLEGVRKVK